MGRINLSGVFQHKSTSMTVQLQMYIFKEDCSYIVYCPALDLSAYGDTEEQAKKAFEDIMDITFQYWVNKKTLHQDLSNHGWKIKSKKQKKIKAPTFEEMFKTNEALRDITTSKDYTKYSQNISIPELAE